MMPWYNKEDCVSKEKYDNHKTLILESLESPEAIVSQLLSVFSHVTSCHIGLMKQNKVFA